MPHAISRTLLNPFFHILNLAPKPALAWHRARLAGELHELTLAPTPLLRLSETADVFFTIARAAHEGFHITIHASRSDQPNQQDQSIQSAKRTPLSLVNMSNRKKALAWLYMLGKFGSRWAFYKVAGWKCGKGWGGYGELVNPGKEGNVREVAGRMGVDGDVFVKACEGLRRRWLVLP